MTTYTSLGNGAQAALYEQDTTAAPMASGRPSTRIVSKALIVGASSALLLEAGGALLLEAGDRILLEA